PCPAGRPRAPSRATDARGTESPYPELHSKNWKSHSRTGIVSPRQSGRARMCGRFTLRHSWREIVDLYRLTAPADRGRNTEARYNICPTQDILFVTADDSGGHMLREGRWWLVPGWARELPKYPMFNARSEEVATKPAF